MLQPIIIFYLVILFYPSGVEVFERALHLVLSSAETLARAQTAPLPSTPVSYTHLDVYKIQVS